MSRQVLAWAGLFWVTTRAFLVTTEPLSSMSRHGFHCVVTKFAQGREKYVTTELVYVATKLAKEGKVCHGGASLCHDIGGQGRDNFYHDRGLLGRKRAGHNRNSYHPQQSWTCVG